MPQSHHCAAILVILLHFISPLPSKSQWKMVAPALLGTQDIQMGAITHKSGITWAGSYEVFMSADSGVTWTKRWTPSLGRDYINDIRFYDSKIGIVCTHNGWVYRTDDQGLSWREIHRSGATSAAFLDSPDQVVVTSGLVGTIEITHDGGLNWIAVSRSAFVQQVRPLLGGSALVMEGDLASGKNWISKTTDYGATWQKTTGTFDVDSYSFDVNPCAPLMIYAVNEEGTQRSNDFSEIFASSDGGNSWTVSQNVAINRNAGKFYFNGSIVLTTKAIYVQTTVDGVHRSLDQGATWKPIGGPSATFDTRLLCAINSNIILAADNTGSIWRTLNSGNSADSIFNATPYESLSITPTELFTFDTLVSCDSPRVEKVNLHAILCQYPKIISQRISGIDSDDYLVRQPIADSLSGDDSALISFRPHGNGNRTGNYIITLEDGTQITIPLKGFGRGVIFVRPLTHDVSLDTIGGFAEVPLTFKGFTQTEDLEVILHYDKRMKYERSISLSGTSLDIPGESWLGRAKLRISKNDVRFDTATGIAIFTVYPDGDDCYKVALDSMNILNPFAPCTYSIGNPVTATICPPRGCGIMTLTNYMLHGTIPQLRIFPNPTSESVNIFSYKNLGECTLVLYDELGRNMIGRTIKMGTGENHLSLTTMKSGIYLLKITSSSGTFTQTLLLRR